MAIEETPPILADGEEWQVKHLGYLAAFEIRTYEQEEIKRLVPTEPQRSNAAWLELERVLMVKKDGPLRPELNKVLPKGAAFHGVRRLATGMFLEFFFERRPTVAQLGAIQRVAVHLLATAAAEEIERVVHGCPECGDIYPEETWVDKDMCDNCLEEWDT